MDYLYEQFEHVSGKTILQHPFIGFDPSQSSSDRKMRRTQLSSGGANSRSGQADLESQRQGLVCFICHQGKEKHATAEDMKFIDQAYCSQEEAVALVVQEEEEKKGFGLNDLNNLAINHEEEHGGEDEGKKDENRNNGNDSDEKSGVDSSKENAEILEKMKKITDAMIKGA